MTSTIPYSHSSTPIMETWLIKALRLAHSKKPADHERLRKFYREVCENEAMVSRITLADALREPRESSSTESTERDQTVQSGMAQQAASSTTGTTNSAVVRIRPALLTTEPASTSSSSTDITATTTVSTGMTLLSSLTGSMTSSAGPDANAARANKRTRVAFFNIFDATSPSSTAVTVVSKNSTTPLSAISTTFRTPSGSGTTSVAPSSTHSAMPTTPSATQSTTNPIVTGTIDLTGDPTESQCTVAELLPSVTIPVVTTNITDNSGTGGIATSVDHVVGTVAHIRSQTTTTTSSTGADAPTADAQLLASLVADLVCCVCGKLTRQPQMEPDGKTMNANMLVECIQCGALYHQMCHRPPVLSSSGASNKDQWRCGSCLPTVSSESIVVCTDPEVAMSSTTTTAATITLKSASVTVTSDTGPTVGARKRKAGLQSSLAGSNFRRLL